MQHASLLYTEQIDQVFIRSGVYWALNLLRFVLYLILLCSSVAYSIILLVGEFWSALTLFWFVSLLLVFFSQSRCSYFDAL